MNTLFTKPLMMLAIAGTIAACSSDDPVAQSYKNEAGSLLDSPFVGSATRRNIAYMSDERLYSLELARRFANEVLTNVTFAFNSAELDQGARDIIQEQATWIMQFPELRFRIYGHADSPGSTRYNKNLGLKRARTVMAYMVSLGIERSRLEALASVGETQPLIVSEDRERRNRRVVTEVTGFLPRHPTVMNGEFAHIAYREYIKQGSGGGNSTSSMGNPLQISN